MGFVDRAKRARIRYGAYFISDTEIVEAYTPVITYMEFRRISKKNKNLLEYAEENGLNQIQPIHEYALERTRYGGGFVRKSYKFEKPMQRRCYSLPEMSVIDAWRVEFKSPKADDYRELQTRLIGLRKDIHEQHLKNKVIHGSTMLFDYYKTTTERGEYPYAYRRHLQKVVRNVYKRRPMQTNRSSIEKEEFREL